MFAPSCLLRFLPAHAQPFSCHASMAIVFQIYRGDREERCFLVETLLPARKGTRNASPLLPRPGMIFCLRACQAIFETKFFKEVHFSNQIFNPNPIFIQSKSMNESKVSNQIQIQFQGQERLFICFQLFSIMPPAIALPPVQPAHCFPQPTFLFPASHASSRSARGF